MNFDFKNISFLNLIKSKKEQILKKTMDEVQESPGFKIFIAGLKSMLNNNAFNGFKVLLIRESEILDTRLDNVGDFDVLFANVNFAYNSIITIDKKLSILESKKVLLPQDGPTSRKYYSKMSDSGDVVFLLIGDKINYFIGGEENGESPFFSLADVNAYNAKRDIRHINDVFGSYQESLKDRRSYCKFFIELSHLKSLHHDLSSADTQEKFIADYAHLLRNKPEDTFRDDLRQFLITNLRASEVKEFLLENMRRLDIYLHDEYGEIYLIEVKWVGDSIHQLGKKVGTSYKGKDINPAAFVQTLDYLEQLDNKGKNIIRAFLVVFDARKEDLPDTGTDFDESALSTVQAKHFRKFEKIRDLRVRNTHPS